MIRIVLLGGTGFIGEYLAKDLIRRNDCEILIAGCGTSFRDDLYRDVKIIVVLTQPDQEVMEELASLITSSQVLKKVVYLSTLLLYPSSHNKSSEVVLADPVTTYEKDKYREELFLSRVTKDADCKLCIVRLANTYGDIKNKGIINNIILSSLKDEKKLVVQGDPESKIRDYIFIEDAVKILEFLIFYSQQTQKELFNVCTGIGISVKQLIDKIELIIKKEISFTVSKSVLEKKAIIGNNSKILSLSHYQFKYNLMEGLKKTYQNYTNLYLV